MSYVPPHKRQTGSSNRNILRPPQKSLPTSRSQRRFPRSHGHNEPDDARLFCDAFDFIRCINLKSRPDQWQRFLNHGRRLGPTFLEKVERFDAIDGAKLFSDEKTMPSSSLSSDSQVTYGPSISESVKRTWDSTKNSEWDRHVHPGTKHLSTGEIGCALSHVSLWKDLVTKCDTQRLSDASMLILEDDAAFLQSKSEKHAGRFLRAFRLAHELLSNPKEHWDIFYLGFSDRGERKRLVQSGRSLSGNLVVQVFQPTYGFHTHAYVIRKTAAERLLANLPVVGPVDVWLAGNDWFGLEVYCSIVANEGWEKSDAPLVRQDRARSSSIRMSARTQR